MPSIRKSLEVNMYKINMDNARHNDAEGSQDCSEVGHMSCNDGQNGFKKKKTIDS